MQIKNYCGAWLVAAAATLILVTPAQAVPVPGQGTWDSPNPNLGLKARDLNGDGVTDAFYDPEMNITWLRDASVNGGMTWANAVAWAAGYSIGSYSGWRLPTADTTCPDMFNCTGSEMGHLWYDTLGNTAGGPMSNTGDFQNLLSDFYWTNTALSSWQSYIFVTSSGFQDNNYNQWYDYLHGMAVRPGDVAGAQVPEPVTLVLVLTALAGLGLVRRRRPA